MPPNRPAVGPPSTSCVQARIRRGRPPPLGFAPHEFRLLDQTFLRSDRLAPLLGLILSEASSSSDLVHPSAGLRSSAWQPTPVSRTGYLPFSVSIVERPTPPNLAPAEADGPMACATGGLRCLSEVPAPSRFSASEFLRAGELNFSPDALLSVTRAGSRPEPASQATRGCPR